MFFPDKFEGICGGPEDKEPYFDDCYRYLWKNWSCNINMFSMNDWKGQTIVETRKNITSLYYDSIYNNYDLSGRMKRFLCFGITSLNTFNVLYFSKVEPTSESKNPLYKSLLITDGIRSSKMVKGGCFLGENGVQIKIQFKKKYLIRKIKIFAPVLEGFIFSYSKYFKLIEFFVFFFFFHFKKDRQEIKVTIKTKHITFVCNERVILNKEETDVYCLSSQLKPINSILIRSVKNKNLYLCEVEAFTGKERKLLNFIVFIVFCYCFFFFYRKFTFG